MRNHIPVLIGVSVLACSFVFAASPPQTPAAVATALQEWTTMCTEAGGKARTDNAVKRLDLNGDGKEDYVLDVGSIGCEGAASIYGDREKAVYVFAGDGKGGAKEPFTANVYGARVEGTGPAAKLWLSVSGGGCGKPPAKDFASESFCDRPVAWNSAKQAFEFAPVSTVKMIQ